MSPYAVGDRVQARIGPVAHGGHMQYVLRNLLKG